MSGLISGIGNLFGGSAAKTDRREQLGGYGQLNNIFNFGIDTGKAGVREGQATTRSALEQLGPASTYYARLLSGSRPAALQAIQPAVSVAQAQTDAQKRQIAASGAARGGGTATVGQELEMSKQAAIDNALAQARGGAAAGATDVAGKTAAIGGQQLQSAENLLGLGARSAEAKTEIASQSRALSDYLHRKKVEDAANLANTVIGALWGGMGGSPTAPSGG